MLRKSVLSVLSVIMASAVWANSPMKKGTPEIKSISVLEFNNDGILFLGDSKGGMIYAIDLDDKVAGTSEKGLNIADIEGDLAGLLGTSKENVLIHDLAVNPISLNAYLSVSRGRSKWTSRWHLPNDLENSVTLIKISPAGEYSEVSLENIEYSSIEVPNPVDQETEHRWKKGMKLRADALTDLVYSKGKLYATGLSSEEFSSAMWVMDYPFKNASASTLEIFHGAHGKWETASPVRAFLPYDLNGTEHMLAAYLCTPLVTFKTSDLMAGKHLKGKTVAEFGSGNYPLDMVQYQNDGKDYILLSNSQLPLIIFDPVEAANYEGEIIEEVKDYTAGIDFTARSGSGVQQLSDYNDKFILATQRLPSGKLALVSLSKGWMIP